MMVSLNISVIIPHLNQNEALNFCIASLQKQDYPLDKVEIIVVDNGSKITPTLPREAFKSLLVLSEAEPGPGPARNTGVAASGGEMLFFIDADCTADPDWIKSGVSSLLSGDAPIIGGDVQIPIADKTNMTALEAYEMVFAYQQETYIKKVGFSGSGNLATSRTVFDKVGPFPGIEVAEDRAWGASAFKKGFKFTYCPEMIIYHPARETFDEIFQKWARHSRHDFAELKDVQWLLLKWTWRAFLVLGSIPIHAFKVAMSHRLSGFVPKLKAIMALAIIRLYRVGYMLRMIFSKKFRDQDVFWNQ